MEITVMRQDLADSSTRTVWQLTHRSRIVAILLVLMNCLILPLSAQNLFQRFDSVLTENYRKGNIDTTYVMRPTTKWTIKARYNLSGAKIETEGIDNGQHFKSEMTAD